MLRDAAVAVEELLQRFNILVVHLAHVVDAKKTLFGSVVVFG